MSELASFIPEHYRPEICGGRLDKGHKTKFLLENAIASERKELRLNALVFGPKNDKVLLNLEYIIEPADEILILYYEELHQRWTYVQTESESYFLYQKNAVEHYRIKANCLYLRGCQVEVEDKWWSIIGEFYNFLASWTGKVLCSPRAQMNNESKLYQLNHSLRAAQGSSQSISLGKSYVIKGRRKFEQLPQEKSYIVKSLCSIRSIVVDESAFQYWHSNALNNLPVLFQEKVEGEDLRIHVINGKIHGKISLKKQQVDYRYNNPFWDLRDFTDLPQELQNFCRAVSYEEDNALLGIDFIKTENNYVVLEANPSPGWSAYHSSNGIDHDGFIADLLVELKNV